MDIKGKLSKDSLNEEQTPPVDAVTMIRSDKLGVEDNSVINKQVNKNNDKEGTRSKKIKFYNLTSKEKNENTQSNFKVSSPKSINNNINIIRDNLSPKNMFKNYNYYKKNNSQTNSHIYKTNPNEKSYDINLVREKLIPDKAPNKKLISNIYTNLNLLSLRNRNKATFTNKLRLMSSSPTRNSNSTQKSSNQKNLNSSLNKYNYLFNYQRKSLELKNITNTRNQLNEMKRFKNCSYENHPTFYSPKASFKMPKPFSTSSKKNNSKSNSILSYKKNLKTEITVDNTNNKRDLITEANRNFNYLNSPRDQNKVSLLNKYLNDKSKKSKPIYQTENSKISSPLGKKELNYVSFLDKVYNNTKTDNALLDNKDLSIAVTDIEKHKYNLTQNNQNLKNNNKYLIPSKDIKSLNSTIANKNHHTDKLTSFTFGKTKNPNIQKAKNKEKAATNVLSDSKNTKDSKKVNVDKPIAKEKLHSNKPLNIDYSNRIRIVSNIQSPILTRNSSSKNSNFVSPYKDKNNDINRSVKKQTKISFVNPNKNPNSKYAFTSRNFNSQIINKVKKKQFVSYTPPNDDENVNVSSEVDEKVKEEILEKLNNLDLLNYYKLAIERKFMLHNKTNSKETSNGSSQLLIPLELQNSNKNSDLSLNKHNLKLNNLNLEEVDFKPFNTSVDKNNLNIIDYRIPHQNIDLDNLSIKRNSFLDYKLTYLGNNSNNLASSFYTRCFSADKSENLTKEFIRNKYKEVLNHYLSEPNTPIYSFCV